MLPKTAFVEVRSAAPDGEIVFTADAFNAHLHWKVFLIMPVG
jgi:hypothetical protein